MLNISFQEKRIRGKLWLAFQTAIFIILLNLKASLLDAKLRKTLFFHTAAVYFATTYTV